MSVVSTLADSHVSATALPVGAPAELASIRKSENYAHLPGSYVSKPIATESLGSFSESTLNLLLDLGRRITSATAAMTGKVDICYLFNGCRSYRTFQCHSVAPELCREWGEGPFVIPASF